MFARGGGENSPSLKRSSRGSSDGEKHKRNLGATRAAGLDREGLYPTPPSLLPEWLLLLVMVHLLLAAAIAAGFASAAPSKLARSGGYGSSSSAPTVTVKNGSISGLHLDTYNEEYASSTSLFINIGLLFQSVPGYPIRATTHQREPISYPSKHQFDVQWHIPSYTVRTRMRRLRRRPDQLPG
jgi:hypothetical protein